MTNINLRLRADVKRFWIGGLHQYHTGGAPLIPNHELVQQNREVLDEKQYLVIEFNDASVKKRYRYFSPAFLGREDLLVVEIQNLLIARNNARFDGDLELRIKGLLTRDVEGQLKGQLIIGSEIFATEFDINGLYIPYNPRGLSLAWYPVLQSISRETQVINISKPKL